MELSKMPKTDKELTMSEEPIKEISIDIDIDDNWDECAGYIEKKMICFMSILIIGTILLVFVYTVNK